MSEVEFVAKPKVLRLKVGELSHVGRFPFYGEAKLFQEKLKELQDTNQSAEAAKVIEDFFAVLGFPKEAVDQLDSDNFKDFLVMVLGGKKN